jgi:hypothetical protein
VKKIVSLILVGVLFVSSAFAMAEENREEGVNQLVKTIESEKEPFSLELEMVEINGVNMVHLRPVLEAFDYEIEYNNATKSVEITNLPYHSIIKEGDNSYYKLRMAPRKLSSAPVIYNNKFYVPVEFIPTMTNIGMKIEEDSVFAFDEQIAIHSGYISEIEESENGKRITLSDESLEFDMNTSTIIHISKATVINSSLEIGTQVEVISPPIMTMSLPAQTSAIVIFEIK